MIGFRQIGLCLAFALTAAFSASAAPVDFNRDIQPILSDKCFACHGPDENQRKAGLRLDLPEEPFKELKSGSIAIVPGDLENSELVARITTADRDDIMPPPKANKALSQEEVDLLVRWIKEGAQWKRHWSYLPPERPAVPAVKNKRSVRNAIDAFIIARLEQEGLNPARQADKTRLIRRVTLDLTGLPPTPAEVDAFLKDRSAAAYETLVDRLLASPQFGERMAQHWLDLARYADTNGYHIDNHRDLWLWREWVINAFNQNMPFDRFTIEQLAGDLLPDATLDQRIASGFNRNTMVNFEGGADPDEYLTKYIVDRVNTTSTVWLGATMGCAECHDHKYDPFSQKEFYQLYAFFHNVPEKGLDGAKEDPVPTLKVPSLEQAAQEKMLRDLIASLDESLKKRIEEPNPELDVRQAEYERKLNDDVFSNWQIASPAELLSQNGATLTPLEDHSVLVSGESPDQDVYTVSLRTPLADITGFRLEALVDESLPGKGSSRDTNGNFVLSGFEVEVERDGDEDATDLVEPVLGVWHHLGPFKASQARAAFTRAFINERKVELDREYADGTLKWTSQPGWKDGEVHTLPGGDSAATYLYRTIAVQKARPVTLYLGSDDGIQVWLNNQKVFANNVQRGAKADDDQLVVHLSPGENEILLKVNNGDGAHAFYFRADPAPVTQYAVPFATAIASHHQKDFPAASAIDGKTNTGWAIAGHQSTNRMDHQAIFIAQAPVGFPGGARVNVKLKFESGFSHHAIGRFRLALSTSETLTELGAAPAAVQAILFQPPEKRSEKQKIELTRFFRSTYIPEIQQAEKDAAARREELRKLDETIPSSMVMVEMEKPRDTFLLVRGDFQTKGEQVTAGLPAALYGGPPGQMPTNRLQLAQWLVAPDHPLASRVTVNRFWQMLFGTGLVKTANDFGAQGEWPSHPELLDWLSRDFIDSGWDVKRLIKMMVMSASYRRDPAISPEALERDPYNRLLARGPRFRLDAEFIRDQALAVSGLLNPVIGGESVRPYQPPGLWEAVAFGGDFSSQTYVQSSGDDLYRRGIYVYWKRSLPYPLMSTFDAPNRELCTVTRPRTSTPLQALLLMNDPAFVEAARGLAQRVMQEGGKRIDQRLTYAFRLVLARTPNRQERAVLEKIYREQLAGFRADTAAAEALLGVGESPRPEHLDPGELAAWTAIGNILLNLDEAITRG